MRELATEGMTVWRVSRFRILETFAIVTTLVMEFLVTGKSFRDRDR